MSKESEFLDKLRETFKGEAEEHRSAMLAGLLELEKEGLGKAVDSTVIESIFREAHSLKGAARAVDIGGIERLCQSMESIFSALKQAHRRPRKKTFDALYRALDLIPVLLLGHGSEPDRELEEVLKLLHAEGKAGSGVTKSTPAPAGDEDPPPATPSRKTAFALSETVRVSAPRLGSIFLHAEEMLSVTQSTARRAADLSELQVLERVRNRELARTLPAIRRMREQAEGNAPLKRLLNALDWNIDHSRTMTQRLDSMRNAAALDSLHTGERVDSLLREIRTTLMLPFSTLLELFPRMVRDLAVEEGKEVTWEVSGEDTQIDRRVLEEIKDPLIHIVRNSIGHGIETPVEREKRGKPRTGTVAFHVERADNDKVELTVSDDGAGVDLEKVRAAAVARGYLTHARAAALSDPDALRLIFLSELSTSQMITDVSGRGLGLAIAREKIENLGGQIAVDAVRGTATTFRIQIPLSLATFRGVFVRTRGRTFVIPTINVEKVLRVDGAMITLLENRESITIDGRAVSLVNLCDVLGLNNVSEERNGAGACPAIVVLVSGTRIAFRIDEIVGEQEVLVKNLGKQLARVRNISGATVLITGDVVPILNPSDLMKSAAAAAGPVPGAGAREPGGAAIRKILVVEDSVTSRTLLASILESAGYQVRTAVDGVEAFASLRVESCDLLVSDIDMPRMNGFALCEKVRGFASTADIPIILVTSLDSREDRERGIDAGASAYIVKSSFDQANLLEVVKRLI